MLSLSSASCIRNAVTIWLLCILLLLLTFISVSFGSVTTTATTSKMVASPLFLNDKNSSSRDDTMMIYNRPASILLLQQKQQQKEEGLQQQQTQKQLINDNANVKLQRIRIQQQPTQIINNFTQTASLTTNTIQSDNDDSSSTSMNISSTATIDLVDKKVTSTEQVVSTITTIDDDNNKNKNNNYQNNMNSNRRQNHNNKHDFIYKNDAISESLMMHEDDIERLLQITTMYGSIPTQPIPIMIPTPTSITIPPQSSPIIINTIAPTVLQNDLSCLIDETRESYLYKRISAIVNDTSMLLNPNIPQGVAFNFTLSDDLINNNICTYPTLEQRYSLAVLYYSTGGQNWFLNAYWLTPVSECQWLGVICTTTSSINNNSTTSTVDSVTTIMSRTTATMTGNKITSTVSSIVLGKNCFILLISLFFLFFNLLLTLFYFLCFFIMLGMIIVCFPTTDCI
jgi:hypothetical protein